MNAVIRRRPLLWFFVLAYLLSWAWWIPLAVGGAVVTPGSGMPTHAPGLLGPALAAVIVTAATAGRPGLRRLWKSMWHISRPLPRFWLYALSPLFFLVPAGIAALVSGTGLPPAGEFGLYSGLPALGTIPVFALALAVNGFGEELGWRGFALARLQARLGSLGGTLALAGLWACWHAPLFAVIDGYRQMSPATIAGGFLIGITCGAIVLARVAHATSGSVLAVALWHTAYNMTSATIAGRGTVAAATTACTIAWAVLLIVLERRRARTASLLSVPQSPESVRIRNPQPSRASGPK